MFEIECPMCGNKSEPLPGGAGGTGWWCAVYSCCNCGATYNHIWGSGEILTIIGALETKGNKNNEMSEMYS